MCNLCCSHAGLDLTTPHSCLESVSPLSEGTIYHVGVFSIGLQGIAFPGEKIHLDVYRASELRLISDIQTTGLNDAYHSCFTDFPAQNQVLLPRVFAITPNANARYGTLAVSTSDSTRHRNNYIRFTARAIARYEAVGGPVWEAAYPCVAARLICDIPHPRLSLPFDKAFPRTLPSTLFPQGRTGVRTRSSVARDRRTIPLRSSALMGGLPFKSWLANCPEYLVSQAREVAKYSRLLVDQNIVEENPLRNDCPTRWSFWFCAVLDVMPSDSDSLLQMLGETSVILRLKRIISILEQSSLRPTRKRVLTDHVDRDYRPKKRAKGRNKDAPDNFENASSSEPQTQQRSWITYGSPKLEPILRVNPWPQSQMQGFASYDSKSMVKGRFKEAVSYAG